MRKSSTELRTVETYYHNICYKCNVLCDQNNCLEELDGLNCRYHLNFCGLTPIICNHR